MRLRAALAGWFGAWEPHHWAMLAVWLIGILTGLEIGLAIR